MRLLLVDDDPQIGLVVGRVAETCGFEVCLADRADAFKATYETFHPDLITLDLDMPDCDGVELLRFLADQCCTAPILIISGFDDRVLGAAKRLGEARGLNMAGIVSKPMRVTELRDVLNALKPGAAGA